LQAPGYMGPYGINYHIEKKSSNMQKERQNHWDKIYETKQPNEVSWTQEKPRTSLDFIHGFSLNKKANIIDIGVLRF
jgi:hypothetical protein